MPDRYEGTPARASGERGLGRTRAHAQLAATVVVGALLAWAPSARAHDAGRPGERAAIQRSIVAELASPPQPAPGVSAKVLPGEAPGILLDATAARWTVTVLGPAGEPFVRLGARGAEVNVRSASERPPSAGGAPVDPRAAPRWQRVSEEARYAWLEPRARYPAAQVSDEVLVGGRSRVLSRWRIPLEINGRATELRGVTRWDPVADFSAHRGGASGVPGGLIAALVVATVVGAAGLVAVGRGRVAATRS